LTEEVEGTDVRVEGARRLLAMSTAVSINVDLFGAPVGDGVMGGRELARAAWPAAETARRAILRQHVADAAGGAESYAAVWAATLPRRRLLIERVLRADFAGYVQAFDPALDAAAPELRPLWLAWCARESVARYGEPAESAPATTAAPHGLFGEVYEPALKRARSTFESVLEPR
jgi:hypothetical protein